MCVFRVFRQKPGDIKKAPGKNPGASLVCFVVLKLGHRRPCVAKAKKEEGEKKQSFASSAQGHGRQIRQGSGLAGDDRRGEGLRAFHGAGELRGWLFTCQGKFREFQASRKDHRTRKTMKVTSS